MSLLATSFRRAVRHGDDVEARGEMAMAATFAGLGFGNAGVHIPHANAYPIAGRVRDFHPDGYPGDEPMVPHGMAVSLTAPEAFRCTFESAPERHLRAASLLAPDNTYDAGPDAARPGADRPDERHRDPQRARGGRLRLRRRRRPGRRHAQAAAPARDRPARGRRGGRRRASSPARWSCGERTPRGAAGASTGLDDVDDSALARALYSCDASLYRIPPQVVVRPRDADEVLATIATSRGRPAPADHARRRHLDRRQRGRPGHRGRHQPLAQPGGGDRRRRRGPRACSPGVVHAALQREARPTACASGRTRPRTPAARSAGCSATTPAARGPWATAGRSTTWPRSGSPSPTAPCSTSRVPGTRDWPRWSTSHLSHRAHRVRPVRAPGVGLLLRAPAAGERAPAGPVPGRLRGHARGGARGRGHGSSRTRRPGRSRCSGSRRWPTRPTPYLRCWPIRSSPARGSATGSSTWCAPTAATCPTCRRGTGWLFAEVTGAGRGRGGGTGPGGRPRRRRPAPGGHRPAEQATLWRIREDGAGLAARSLDRQAQSGWEDAAVPPDRLGDYLRDFDALLRDAGLDGVPYGHFGDGCVHVRIDFELDDGEAARPVPPVRGGLGRPGRVVRRLACRASTATAGRARSCCRGCTPPRRST